MRIVAGSLRGRRIEAPPGPDIRPTSDRARQAVFNILESLALSGEAPPLRDAAVLDAFAGTGAMGLEALSRGAADAAFMERAGPALAACRRNAAMLGVEKSCHIVAADCLAPPKADAARDIVFLDPPYYQGLLDPALTALAAAGWIGDGTICVAELAAKEDFGNPAGFEILRDRRYGAARVVILIRRS